MGCLKIKTLDMAILAVLTPIITAPVATAQETANMPTDDPAEGTLARALIGTQDWIKIDGDAQFTFSESNHSQSWSSYNAGNLPVVPADQGFNFENVEVFLHKDLHSNLAFGQGPLPGPMPEDVDFGYSVQLLDGRVSSGRLGGWDLDYSFNKSNKVNKANYFIIPNAYGEVYLPILGGMNIVAGRIGSNIGYEIHPGVRNVNALMSHTYSFMVEPDQLVGALAMGNIYRGSAGLLSYDFGVNNGTMTASSPNGQRNFQTGLHYRSEDMRWAVDYGSLFGNNQISPDKNVADFPVTAWHGVISPNDQMFQYHSLSGSYRPTPQWKIWSEFVFGRQDGDGRADTIQVTTGKGGFTGAIWSGLTIGATYKMRPDLWYTVRMEHFRDPDGFQLPAGVRSAYNDVTMGVHYDLNKYMQLRPEIRYDWQSDYKEKAYGDDKYASQLTISSDVIVYF